MDDIDANSDDDLQLLGSPPSPSLRTRSTTDSTTSGIASSVASIEMKLRELVNSEEEVIKEMAVEMKKKFLKYWEEYSVTLAFGSILDPMAKLQFLSTCYKRLSPYNFQDKVDRVKEALYRLFGEYEQVGASNSSK